MKSEYLTNFFMIEVFDEGLQNSKYAMYNMTMAQNTSKDARLNDRKKNISAIILKTIFLSFKYRDKNKKPNQNKK